MARPSMDPSARLAFVTAALLGACGEAGDARVPDPVEPGPGEMRVLTEGRTDGLSASGIAVRLQVEPFPVPVGPVFVRVEAAGTTALPRPTLDLVSPTMPMHGVVRYDAEEASGGFATTMEVPMEGRWAIYVNLDDGADAAWFEFEVAPGDSAAGRDAAPSHTH